MPRSRTNGSLPCPPTISGQAAQWPPIWSSAARRASGSLPVRPTVPRAKIDFAGFRERLAENGIEPVAFAEADYRYEGGRAAALAIFTDAHPPDALFCANDLMAMGAMDALRTDLGLRVPDDVLVAGFDDIPAAAWAAYGLTTVVQDASRMVDKTIALLRATMAQHDPPGGVGTIVPARLVVRDSTGR